MKKTLYIIDGHALIYAAYYAPMRQNLVSPKGVPTKATYIFTNTLLGLIDKKKPDMLVVAMDSKAEPLRRKLYSEYKAHRPPMPEDMPVQIENIEAILEAMRVPVLRKDGYEADDIIGTLCVKGAKKDYNVLICSRDKDMLQLLGDNVAAYDIKKDEVRDVEWLDKEMGVKPSQFVDVLALQGDTADNVPGAPDVGPKTAIQWITEYGSLDKLYEHADEIKGKRGDALRDNKELVYLSKELVTIDCDSPVELNDDEFVLDRSKYDETKLTDIFTELGFTKLLQSLGLVNGGGQPGLFDSVGSAKDEGSFVKPGGPDNIETVEHEYRLIDTDSAFEEFIEELSKHKEFAIDTETTSIKAMEADLVGLNFSWKKGTGYYVAVKAPLGQKTVSMEKVKKLLGPILADGNVKKIGQNLKYDLLVLNNAGFEVFGADFDTMIASYVLWADRRSNSMDSMAMDYLNYQCVPISELIGKGRKQKSFDEVETSVACDYACEDADVTWQLYEHLKRYLEKSPELRELFEKIEMPLMLVLVEMEKNGVKLNVQILKAMSQELAEKLEELTDGIYGLSDEVFNIDSPKQLSEVLFDKLGLPEIKKRSTDASVLEELIDGHEIIPLILEYRQLSKLKNTYLDKLPTMINCRTERLHASFNQTVAATGRLSSSDPNLQNIPIRTDIGRKIRSAFVPSDEKSCILSADYSQVELRLLAHLSGDEELISAFNHDMDIHSFVASQVYGVDISEVDSEMRSRCKAVNFGIIYGQGPFRLSKAIGVTQREAKRFIDDYFKRYASIKEFMAEVLEKSKEAGFAETILGRRRPITGLKSKNFNVRSQAERMAFNTVIQGSAADLIKKAMINIQRKIEDEKLPIKMILQIHDELVFEVPEDKADEYAKFVQQEMASALDISVPLKVDVGYGKSWMTGH